MGWLIRAFMVGLAIAAIGVVLAARADTLPPWMVEMNTGYRAGHDAEGEEPSWHYCFNLVHLSKPQSVIEAQRFDECRNEYGFELFREIELEP